MLWLFAALPILTGPVLHLGSNLVARRCRPATAARVLVTLALLTSLASGLVLCALGVVAVGELPLAARAGHWSADVVSDRVGVPIVLGLIIGATAVGLVASALVQVARVAVRLRMSRRACRDLRPGPGRLVLIDDPELSAYSVPSRGGVIVVSRQLMGHLQADERRALLAHEAAHLRHRHHLYIQAAEVAAAANPFLRRLVAVVRCAVESWADQAAVGVTGDPTCVARAIARAGLARRATAPPVSLAIAESDVAARVRLLLEPRRPGGASALAFSVVVVAAAVAALVLAGRVDHALDTARFTSALFGTH